MYWELEVIEHLGEKSSRCGMWVLLWGVAAITFLVLAALSFYQGWKLYVSGSGHIRLYGYFIAAGLLACVPAVGSLLTWRSYRSKMDLLVDRFYDNYS